MASGINTRTGCSSQFLQLQHLTSCQAETLSTAEWPYPSPWQEKDGWRWTVWRVVGSIQKLTWRETERQGIVKSFVLIVSGADAELGLAGRHIGSMFSITSSAMPSSPWRDPPNNRTKVRPCAFLFVISISGQWEIWMAGHYFLSQLKWWLLSLALGCTEWQESSQRPIVESLWKPVQSKHAITTVRNVSCRAILMALAGCMPGFMQRVSKDKYLYRLDA